MLGFSGRVRRSLLTAVIFLARCNPFFSLDTRVRLLVAGLHCYCAPLPLWHVPWTSSHTGASRNSTTSMTGHSLPTVPTLQLSSTCRNPLSVSYAQSINRSFRPHACHCRVLHSYHSPSHALSPVIVSHNSLTLVLCPLSM